MDLIEAGEVAQLPDREGLERISTQPQKGSVTSQKDRARLGGLAVRDKQPPDVCPHCNEPTASRCWMSYLGHLSMHYLAKRYFGGDMDAAIVRVQRNGLARTDPFPANRAFPSYRELTQPLTEAEKALVQARKQDHELILQRRLEAIQRNGGVTRRHSAG